MLRIAEFVHLFIGEVFLIAEDIVTNFFTELYKLVIRSPCKVIIWPWKYR